MNDAYVAEYVVARSAATMFQSRLRIASSRREIAATKRRRWRAIRGGSGPGADATAAHLRGRILLLVNPSEIPRIFTNFCIEPKPCDICGREILRGSSEYEIGFSSLSFRLDADCFGLWQEEMLRTAKRRNLRSA